MMPLSFKTETCPSVSSSLGLTLYPLPESAGLRNSTANPSPSKYSMQLPFPELPSLQSTAFGSLQPGTDSLVPGSPKRRREQGILEAHSMADPPISAPVQRKLLIRPRGWPGAPASPLCSLQINTRLLKVIFCPQARHTQKQPCCQSLMETSNRSATEKSAARVTSSSGRQLRKEKESFGYLQMLCLSGNGGRLLLPAIWRSALPSPPRAYRTHLPQLSLSSKWEELKALRKEYCK